MSLIYEKLFERVNTEGAKIKGCLHIGADWGQEYELYKQNGIDNIIFYEPLPHVFDILKQHVGDGADLRNIALGNQVGEVEMFVEDNNYSQSSSVLEPEFHLSQYPSITFPRKQKVKINTIDKEIFNREDFNLMNIDVQGYELEVLKGTSETLHDIDYIVSEINEAEMYKGCAKVDDLDEFLECFGFDRGYTEWHQGIQTWGNAIYWREW